MLSNIEIMVSSFQFWRFASTHLMRLVFQECQLRRILSQHLGAACENPVDSGKMPSVYALGFEVLIHKVGPLLIFDDGPRVRNRVDRTDRTPEGALAQICPFRVVSSSSFCMERQVECPDLTMNNLIWCWQNWIHHWRCGLVNSFNQITPTAKWLDSGLVWPY